MTGKLSQLVGGIHKTITTKKVLNKTQLDKLDNNAFLILLTTEELLDQVESKLTLFELVMIISEEDNKKSDQLVYISQKLMITQLGQSLNDFIDKKLTQLTHLSLSIDLFDPETSYPCDLYVQINPTKYLKILNSNDHIEKQKLQKLSSRGAKHLYVLKEDYEGISSLIRPRHKLTKQAKKTLIHVNAIEAVCDYIVDVGVDHKVVNMLKGIQNQIEGSFDQNFVKEQFLLFQDMAGSFLYNHSYLTASIALGVGQKYTWMNPANKEKIFLASILHDLGHQDKDHAKFEGLSKIALETLDEDIRNSILGHPDLFSQKLSQVSDIHEDIIKIVRDHHGVRDEDFYPKKVYPTEINLIFALFILSHEFVLRLFASSFDLEKVPIITDELVEEFSKGSYKKILPDFTEFVLTQISQISE